MHVITKIFIVLVSLLAVLLVPLVVVYAYNENSYKSRFQAADLQAAAAGEALKAAEARAGADQARLQTEIDALAGQVKQLQNDKATAQVTVRQLESELATSKATQTEILANIGSIRTSVDAGQQLIDSLVSELRTLRADAIAIERQRVELDEALRDVTSQLEVAEQARRALAEELARLKDEHSKALTRIGEFKARYGDIGSNEVRGGIMPDVTLTAHVIRVERSSREVLAEIDAGSVDGVKKDWELTLGRGGEFMGKLRIVNVDLRRSTGVVSLEDKNRKVEVGDTAHAVAGQR